MVLLSREAAVDAVVVVDAAAMVVVEAAMAVVAAEVAGGVLVMEAAVVDMAEVTLVAVTAVADPATLQGTAQSSLVAEAVVGEDMAVEVEDTEATAAAVVVGKAATTVGHLVILLGSALQLKAEVSEMVNMLILT